MGGMREELRILGFSQAPDDAAQSFVSRNLELSPQAWPSLLPIRKRTRVDAQRDHGELPTPTDTKLFVDLAELLSANDDDAIRGQSRQQSLNAEKQARLRPAVITVKDLSAVSMHKL